MDSNEGSCSDKKIELACRSCSIGVPLSYWCETCQRQVPDKRCPDCGLKSRKVRRAGC